MATTIQFNTGRRYTSEGQVIRATLHDDCIVTFMDHSRSIDGEFDIVFPEFFSKEAVLAVYDQGGYQSTSRSRQDGMYRGGCNTRQEG